eukprot:2856042-Karenia_brevis.AAC.1
MPTPWRPRRHQLHHLSLTTTTLHNNHTPEKPLCIQSSGEQPLSSSRRVPYEPTGYLVSR